MTDHTGHTDRGAARTVLVTGAGGGLGRAFALGFASRGHRVAVADIDTDGAEETARLVKDTGAEAWAGRVDVTDEASTRELAGQVADFGGGSIDVLVNNAAVYGTVTRSPLEDIDPAEWDLVMAVNLKGPWLMTRAVTRTSPTAGASSTCRRRPSTPAPRTGLTTSPPRAASSP